MRSRHTDYAVAIALVVQAALCFGGISGMVNVGTAKTRTLSDKWTVVTADGERSAHFEHTVAIAESGPRILTL